MAGRRDPERATDLRERRALYEQRAHSLRYGHPRPGSRRHLAQCLVRTLTDLARPGRAFLVLCTVLAVVVTTSSVGISGVGTLVTIVAAAPLVLTMVTLTQFAQQTVAGRRRSRGTDPAPSPVTGGD